MFLEQLSHTRKSIKFFKWITSFNLHNNIMKFIIIVPVLPIWKL